MYNRDNDRSDPSRSRHRSGRSGGLRVAYVDEATGQEAGKAASRGVCRYLKVSMWHSEIMYALPQKGRARYVYLYLLTGPHTLGYHVPGLYQLGKHALMESLSLGPQEFSKVFTILRETTGLKTDFERAVVWIPSALEHLGPPANPNIVRGYCRAMQAMPKSDLIEEAIAAYRPFLASLGHIFLKPFENHFGTVCQTVSKPFGIDKREEIIDIQSEGEIVDHERGLAQVRAIMESFK
jgi:hypothetical protein